MDCDATQPLLPIADLIPLRDGEPYLRPFVNKYYSARRYHDGRNPRRIVGPGEYLILSTPCRRALIVFRVSNREIAGQKGIYLSFCRNETSQKTSVLIRKAIEIAWERWPGKPVFTLVNPKKVQSPIPGYCFRRAGFRRVAITSRGLLVLRRNSPNL